MADDESTWDAIQRFAAEQHSASDDQILALIEAIPPLADENDPCWDDVAYWKSYAHPYVAMAHVAGMRKLRRAVRPLLERACYGDPGEIMRGLRHTFEGVYKPDWNLLADEYLALARAERLGTRLWAVASLTVLDDPRAAPVFEASVREDPEEISSWAKGGLKRLRRGGQASV